MFRIFEIGAVLRESSLIRNTKGYQGSLLLYKDARKVAKAPKEGYLAPFSMSWDCESRL